MMKYFIIILSLLFSIGCFAQEDFAKAVNELGCLYSPNPNYEFLKYHSSHCKEKVWSCKVSALGKSTGIWLSKDGQCEVGVFLWKKRPQTNVIPQALLYPPKKKDKFPYYSKNRIYQALNLWSWVMFSTPPDYLEKDMLMLLTKYPKKLAKKYFNADGMYVFPYDMGGRKCRDKYSVVMYVYVHVNYRTECPHLMFLMTDESAKNFDKYLEEFQKTIWVDRKWKAPSNID